MVIIVIMNYECLKNKKNIIYCCYIMLLYYVVIFNF